VTSAQHLRAGSQPGLTFKAVRAPFRSSLGRAPRTGIVAAASQDEYSDFGGKYPQWDNIQKQLVQKYGLPSISPQDAAAMVADGRAVLLDVRLKKDFEESHPREAVSAPAFRIIEMSDGAGVGRFMKMALMAVNGVTPTEPNPDFGNATKAAVAGSDKAVIVACEAGGSSLATSTFPTGKPSRSLKAAWRLLHTGTLPADRMYHLDGGVLGWYNAGLPMEGEYDTARAFKSPNAVSVGKKD